MGGRFGVSRCSFFELAIGFLDFGFPYKIFLDLLDCPLFST